MKKLFLTVVVTALLICSMAIGVGAKVVNVSDNTSTVKAPTVEFGDQISVNVSFKDEIYYKFSVEYNGVVTIDCTHTCSLGENHSLHTRIHCYVVDKSENRIGSFSLNSDKAYDNVVYEIELTPGEYYFIFDKPVSYCLSCTRLKAELSFECLHLDIEEKIIRESTCSEEGYIEEICSECGEVADEYEIDRLDHTPADEWTVTRETSCKEAGEKVKYCTVCGEEAEVEEIEILDHTWSDWTTTKEPTCEDAGSKFRTCSVCGYKNEREIEELGHEWGKDEVIDKATCDKEGLLNHTCEVCGKTEEEPIEKEDHKFGSWKTTEKATETSKGEKERTCKNCDFAETETIDKLVCGEEFSWETTKKATCTTNGTRKKVCDFCGKTLSTETVYADGHEWGEWKITREPTVTRNGEKQRECEICGETEEKSVTLTHGDYGEWKITKEATCIENGKKEFVCYCCNKTTKTETIKATGHKFGQYKTEQSAMPDKDGKQTAKCENCNETKNEAVEYSFEELKKQSPKKHTFGDVKQTSWYNEPVSKCYHYGLMVGNSETTFNPAGNITRAEVITSAVRIYCLYNPDDDKPKTGTSPWYKGYVDYALEKGIIKDGDFDDYTKTATRAEMAYIFVNAVGEEELEKINNVTSIPDVKNSDKYGKEIFALYNAGVLTGNDDEGTFAPERNISRAESATIIARISKISDRVKK